MRWFITGLATLFVSRLQLMIEIAYLRQQLAVYERRQTRLALQGSDRRFWILMYRLLSRWQCPS